jgi:hypothetical protein
MTLKIQLAIKVRWKVIGDIFKFDQTFDVDLPVPPVPVHLSHVLVNDRGVFLKVWNV